MEGKRNRNPFFFFFNVAREKEKKKSWIFLLTSELEVWFCYFHNNNTSLVAQTIKNLLAKGETGFNPWVGKISWRRTWQFTPVSLPGESPWTEEPGQIQSMGSQRVGHNWAQQQQYSKVVKLNCQDFHFPWTQPRSQSISQYLPTVSLFSQVSDQIKFESLKPKSVMCIWMEVSLH